MNEPKLPVGRHQQIEALDMLIKRLDNNLALINAINILINYFIEVQSDLIHLHVTVEDILSTYPELIK